MSTSPPIPTPIVTERCDDIANYPYVTCAICKKEFRYELKPSWLETYDLKIVCTCCLAKATGTCEWCGELNSFTPCLECDDDDTPPKKYFIQQPESDDEDYDGNDD